MIRSEVFKMKSIAKCCGTDRRNLRLTIPATQGEIILEQMEKFWNQVTCLINSGLNFEAASSKSVRYSLLRLYKWH